MSSEKENTLQQMNNILEKTPMTGRHSYFQLKYFIIGKEPTIQAKLWQCIREIKARKESLVNMELEKEEIKDKIVLIQIEIENLKEVIPCEERKIKIRQTERRLLTMEKALADLVIRQKETEEEAEFFLKAYTDLENVEKVKDYDDPDAQKEYWSARFTNELNMKLMLENRIDAELAKAVLAMPDDTIVKKELVGLLNRQQSVLEAK